MLAVRAALFGAAGANEFLFNRFLPGMPGVENRCGLARRRHLKSHLALADVRGYLSVKFCPPPWHS